jgi:hypothetical protein
MLTDTLAFLQAGRVCELVCSHRTGSLFCAALTKLWPGLSDAVGGGRLPSTDIGVALLQCCCNHCLPLLGCFATIQHTVTDGLHPV